MKPDDIVARLLYHSEKYYFICISNLAHINKAQKCHNPASGTNVAETEHI